MKERSVTHALDISNVGRGLEGGTPNGFAGFGLNSRSWAPWDMG